MEAMSFVSWIPFYETAISEHETCDGRLQSGVDPSTITSATVLLSQ
jgi:hypothetical protein